MRIAIEAGTSWRNRAGTGIYVRNLFSAMEKVAPEHSYLYLAASAASTSATLDVSERSKVQRLMNGLGQMAWLQVSLPLQLRKSRASVFHAPAMIGPFWQPCPAVFTVLDLAIIRYPQAFDPLWRWYTLVALQLALPRAEAVIAISESTRQDVIRYIGLPSDRVRVIYCGYDKGFRPIEDRELLAAVRLKFGLPERFILNVGTLEPRKNVPRLLEAFQRLKSEYGIPHKLVIVGERGWRYDDIFRHVQQSRLEQEVIFTGHVDADDLPALYCAAELLAFPSLYEGFGLPLLEAMACGCPIVTSTVSSLPEVVGNAALCVDPYDARALAEAMAVLLLQPEKRAALVDRGFERAKLFSWEHAAAETVEIYTQIARDTARAGVEVK